MNKTIICVSILICVFVVLSSTQAKKGSKTKTRSRERSHKTWGNVKKSYKGTPAFSNYGNRAQDRKTTPFPAYRRLPPTIKDSRKKSQKFGGNRKKSTKLPPAFNTHGNWAQARKTTPVPEYRPRPLTIHKQNFASAMASPRKDVQNFYSRPNLQSQRFQGLNNYATNSRPFSQATFQGNTNYDANQAINSGSHSFRGANFGQNLLSAAAGYLGGLASRPYVNNHQTGNEAHGSSVSNSHSPTGSEQGSSQEENPGTNEETELDSTTEEVIEVNNNDETALASSTQKMIKVSNNEGTALAPTTENLIEVNNDDAIELASTTEADVEDY